MTKCTPLLLALLFAGCAVPLSAELSLTLFDKTPDAIDVTGAAQDVTCAMTIVPSGGRTVQYAACSFKSPDGRREGCLATNPAGDVWSCDLTIPPDSEQDTWVLEYIFAEDDLGAKLFVTGAEMVADVPNVIATAGEVDLAVTSTAEDVTPPTIASFAAVPLNVEPGSTVTCQISVDPSDVASLKDVGCSFVPDDASASVSCVGHGTDTCQTTIPVSATPGVIYNEINHFARDMSLNVSVADGAKTFTVGAAPTTGNIAVDMSLRPAECSGASWLISPGALSGTGDLSPTPVTPDDYTITWLDTALGCTNPVAELKTVVADATTTFDLAPANYTLRSTFAGVDIDVGVDGNFGVAPPGGGFWVIQSDILGGQFAASGTGDVTGVVPTQGDFYVGRDYTLSWGPETDHTAPAPQPITTSGTYQGSYTDLQGAGCDGKVAELSTSGGSWVSSAIQTEANAVLTYTAYVRAASVETIVSISAVTPITEFSDNAMMIRWNGSGNFDVYDGSVGDYRADATIPATLNVWHKLIITADVQAGTYSVDVSTCDETPVTLIADDGTPATFRNGASTPGSQFYYNLWSFTGTAEIAQTPTWTPEACVPDTCTGSPPLECGTPDDGCGTPLACGDTCTGGDVCFPEGTCCPPDDFAAVCTTPGRECDSWSDGCGGTVDCGTCPGGDICSAGGTCVTPGSGNFGDPYVYATLADVGVTIGPGVVAPYPTVAWTGGCTLNSTTMAAAVSSGYATGSGTTLDPYVIENKVITCTTLKFDDHNITIRNCEVNLTDQNEGGNGMRMGQDNRTFNGFTLEYSYLNYPNPNGKILNAFGGPFRDFVVRNSHVEGGYDWFFMEGDLDGMLIENNVLGPLGCQDDPFEHADGFQLGNPGYPTSGDAIIRGNQVLTDLGPQGCGKTAFFWNATGVMNATLESNNLPVWGAHTVWSEGGILDFRYNTYTPAFEAAVGNRCNDQNCTGAPRGDCCFWPIAAARWETTSDPASVAECNRYESDGAFVEDVYFHNITHETTGCPDYP